MKIKNNTDKSEIGKLLIYEQQFKDDYKLIFHIVNTFYPVVNGNTDRLIAIIARHTHSTVEDIRLTLDEVLNKYDATQSNVVQLRCFSHMVEVLAQEDMYFTQSDKKRLVTLKEYKFLIHRITKHLLGTEGCKSILTNNYFLKSGFTKQYKKKTTKALSSHKLAHMMPVLSKHRYLHITFNTDSRRVVQIGPNNPFYMFAKVPDIIDEQEVVTKTDRIIAELTSENTMLQSALAGIRSELDEANKKMEDMVPTIEVDEIRTDLYEALSKIDTMVPQTEFAGIRSELDEANIKIETMKQQVKSLQEKNNGLSEMVIEKMGTIEHLNAGCNKAGAASLSN